MGNKDNIATFYYTSANSNKISSEYDNLFAFIFSPEQKRKIITYFKLYNFSKEDDFFIYNINGKKIPFKILSENICYKADKEFIESTKKDLQKLILKTLKYATHINKPNTRLLIGNSNIGTFDVLICYGTNENEYIIDISKNLIMSKKNYIELFDFKTINEVSIRELYCIYKLIDGLSFSLNDLYELLLASTDIFKELNKSSQFNEFMKRDGMNPNIYALWGASADVMFISIDDFNKPFIEEQEEIDEFTATLEIKTDHITHDQEKNIYIFKDDKIGPFKFRLLSDSFMDGQFKDELLSNKRLYQCHPNSHMIAYCLEKMYDASKIVIVGGYFNINEKDVYYHSWVEVNDNLVVDYNHNIVMKKDDYYKLYETKPINKTTLKDMKEIKGTIEGYGFEFLYMTYNYFGQEIYNDLKRNESVLKK